jgi:hypothetical protein
MYYKIWAYFWCTVGYTGAGAAFKHFCTPRSRIYKKNDTAPQHTTHKQASTCLPISTDQAYPAYYSSEQQPSNTTINLYQDSKIIK